MYKQNKADDHPTMTEDGPHHRIPVLRGVSPIHSLQLPRPLPWSPSMSHFFRRLRRLPHFPGLLLLDYLASSRLHPGHCVWDCPWIYTSSFSQLCNFLLLPTLVLGTLAQHLPLKYWTYFFLLFVFTPSGIFVCFSHSFLCFSLSFFFWSSHFLFKQSFFFSQGPL